jgi:hypothetical protein
MQPFAGAVPGIARHGLVGAGLLALAVCGCGPKAGTVSGVVTYQGKPLPGGFINFNTLDTGGRVADSKSVGILNNGSYKIAGVPTGPARITVQGPSGPVVFDQRLVPMRKPPPVVIPDRYGSVEQTDLNYTVTAGPQTHDIELK